jgi:hypothetical protein
VPPVEVVLELLARVLVRDAQGPRAVDPGLEDRVADDRIGRVHAAVMDHMAKGGLVAVVGGSKRRERRVEPGEGAGARLEEGADAVDHRRHAGDAAAHGAARRRQRRADQENDLPRERGETVEERFGVRKLHGKPSSAIPRRLSALPLQTSRVDRPAAVAHDHGEGP